MITNSFEEYNQILNLIKKVRCCGCDETVPLFTFNKFYNCYCSKCYCQTLQKCIHFNEIMDADYFHCFVCNEDVTALNEHSISRNHVSNTIHSMPIFTAIYLDIEDDNIYSCLCNRDRFNIPLYRVR